MVLTWVSKFTKSSFSSVSTETVPKRKAQKESNFILNYFFAEWASAMAKLLKGPLFPNVYRRTVLGVPVTVAIETPMNYKSLCY